MFTDWHGSLEGPTWIKPRWPEQVVRGLFSFRTNGVSLPPYDSLNMGLHVGDNPQHVLANRALLSRELGGSVDEWVVGAQVHGNQVAVVDDLDLSRNEGGVSVPGVDGLVTARTNITLAVFAADCVPILFFDPIQRVIATAHSGWKGTVLHIARNVVQTMKNRFGSESENIEVWFGPSIRQCCYEVDERVAEPVRQEFGAAHLWRRTRPGKYLLNLQSCIRQDLLAEGLRPEHIVDSGLCTASHRDWLFSHRADHGQTGRLAGAVRLTFGGELG